MVRVKNRYMMVQVKWKHANGCRECRPKCLCAALQRCIRHEWGETTDTTAAWKVLRLADASTQDKTCVIKCKREEYGKVKLAVETLEEVGGWPAHARVLKVSSAMERCTKAAATKKKRKQNTSTHTGSDKLDLRQKGKNKEN